jgi:DNA-binding response OmpR family regulator
VYLQLKDFSMKKILLVSRHEIILASLLNHLYEHGFDSIGALRDAEAVAFLRSFKPDLVILGGYFEDEEKVNLKRQLIDCQPTIKIIDYAGGVKNLLTTVEKAFNNE